MALHRQLHLLKAFVSGINQTKSFHQLGAARTDIHPHTLSQSLRAARFHCNTLIPHLTLFKTRARKLTRGRWAPRVHEQCTMLPSSSAGQVSPSTMGCSKSKQQAPPRQHQYTAPVPTPTPPSAAPPPPQAPPPLPSAPPAPSAPPPPNSCAPGTATAPGWGQRACPELEELPTINGAFFQAMRYHEDRDFVVIVDMSGSMNAQDKSSKDGSRVTRWDNARHAISAIVEKAVTLDDDGITLYLFNNNFVKFENVDSSSRVMDIFNGNRPRGSTNLSLVLSAAFGEHFGKGSPKPTTILVITDGQPNSEKETMRVIENAANRVNRQEELSVTFIQIGDDDQAHRFLKKLDDELDCKVDIVDTLKDDCLQNGLSFEELVFLSVTD